MKNHIARLIVSGALLGTVALAPTQASAQEDRNRQGYVRENDADRFGREQYERGYRQGLADAQRERRSNGAYRRSGDDGWFEDDEAYGRQGLGLLREERELEEGRYGGRGAFGRSFVREYEEED